MVDSTVFPTPTVSFLMTLNKAQYYLSLSRRNEVVAKVSNFIFNPFKFTLLLAWHVYPTEYDTTLWNYGKSEEECL